MNRRMLARDTQWRELYLELAPLKFELKASWERR